MPPPLPISSLAVSAAHPDLLPRALQLAGELSLPWIADPADPSFPLLLVCTAERLELRQTGKGAEGPLWVDFASGAMSFRRRHGGSRGEAIARAVGIKAGKRPFVLDLTAGLGRDGFILAGLGCTVQLVEQSAAVAALLADGLERAHQDHALAGIISRLSLLRADSLEALRHWQGDPPEVIYIDPMYPHRKKSALVKKEMRLLRLLVGDDQNGDQLLAASLVVASNRVVVKRPRLAESLAGPEPSFAVGGKNSRFDVYLP
ncbi:MAG: class I SAM-dependent methyltransferase [Thermodesulfobacteriota bacterium]